MLELWAQNILQHAGRPGSSDVILFFLFRSYTGGLDEARQATRQRQRVCKVCVRWQSGEEPGGGSCAKNDSRPHQLILRRLDALLTWKAVRCLIKPILRRETGRRGRESQRHVAASPMKRSEWS